MNKSIRYSIEKYNFKKDSYYGSVNYRGEKNIADIVSELEGFSQGDLEKFFKVFEVAIKNTLEGYNVNMNFITMYATLKGLFTSEEDSYDPMRHNVEIIIEPGKKINSLIEKINLKLKKVKNLRR